MIFSLLAKYWKSILDALIIVAIILVVFLVNPWNMFGGGLKTHQTANNISAIREIGQLITAEYYGEAISTIDQSRLRMIYADDVNARANIVFYQLKQDLLTIYANEVEKMERTSDKKEGFWTFKWFRRAKKDRKASIKKIEETLALDQSISKDSLYPIIIEYFWMIKTNSKQKPEDSIKEKDEKTALWILMQDITYNAENSTDKEFDKYMRDDLPEYNNQVFSDFYYQKKRAKITKKEEKKELSMIGRGWVKAGFDFGKLDESNFLFDKDEGVVHLFGVHAEILNADINPWFIPEKKIPGFQIIESNRHVDFYDAVKVKMYCIEKLRKMALDAGILEQAEIQGKEALKGFISLVSGTEVKEVYFHYDIFSVYTKEILSDQFISYSESRMLDTLIENQLDSIIKLDTAKKDYISKQKIKEVKIHQLQTAIMQMKKCWFEERGLFYNRLSAVVYRITTDSILTHSELKEIANYRWELNSTLNKVNYRISLENQVWYNDELEFINEYNNAIFKLERKTKYYANRYDTLFSGNRELNSFITVKNIAQSQILAIKQYNTSVLFTYIDNVYNPTSLVEYQYHLEITYDWQEQLNNKINISSTVGVKTTKINDTLSIGAVLLSQIEVDTNFYFAYKKLAVSKNEDNLWKITDSLDIGEEEELYLEYLITHYKQTKSLGFFTKANRRMKETLDPEALQKRTANFRKRLQSYTGG